MLIALVMLAALALAATVALAWSCFRDPPEAAPTLASPIALAATRRPAERLARRQR